MPCPKRLPPRQPPPLHRDGGSPRGLPRIRADALQYKSRRRKRGVKTTAAVAGGNTDASSRDTFRLRERRSFSSSFVLGE
ncbi:hypothetical protein IscW_ISCW007072 [Ixodes scapularis]|uniref:Uncharacterized protein n=1 Tax=Ixodes scapularis TaxID=6945 RepID=B7PRP1_IXOSC|nr:hypothetical protein IscW_ISCW007072 [Ixodes scapularis]|eukprot:XP_002400541.1 hypothetical protein IscW_ISCW007072 [Ixodes scapularis]